MMGKTSTPSLKQLAKEADTFKKQLDSLQKGCASTLNNPTTPKRAEKLKAQYGECVDLRNNMTDLQKRITKMTKAEEPTKMSNFDSRKEEELKRLEKMMIQVKEMEKSLEPDEVEDDYYSEEEQVDRKIKEDLNSEEDLVDGDEEDEGEEEYEDEEGLSEEEGSYEEEESEYEDEEVEEEEDEDEGGTDDGAGPNMRIEYEALHDFDKQEEGDLTVKTGEVVTLQSVRDDGWWECENADGETGYVPSTFLKQHIKYADLMQDDEATTPASPRTGKELWGSIKKAMTETSATDVLHALGAVPAGFREPTSARLQSANDKHTHLNYSSVKLGNSNLFYKDLFYNPATQKVRPRTARIQKVVTLMEAKNIPPPGANTVVLSRLARVSLFDGVKFLSNIVTVQAQCTDKEGKNWRFLIKPNSLESSECFVRIMEPSNQTGILIELSVVYTKEAGGKVNELSCGWAFKPMYEENGTLILNKEYDLAVNGGTPFEKNIEVDPSIARRTSAKIMSLLSRNKQPVLTVRTSAANNEQKEKFDVLPNVVVGKVCYLHALALYRHHLACVLIRDRDNLQSTESISDPFLTHFPSLLEQPDLTDVLLESWDSKLKTKSRTERRDMQVLTSTLIVTFTEWIYPLMHLNIPPYKLGFPEALQERTTIINQFLSKSLEKNTPVAAMLDPSFEYEPFDMSEVSYSMIGQHCVTVV